MGGVVAKKRGRPAERTTGEAARILTEALGRRVTAPQVRRWIQKNMLGGTHLADSWYKTTDHDLDVFIEANTHNSVDTGSGRV